MSKIKISEFHIPFIKELVFVALITMVSMISVHFLSQKHIFTPNKTILNTSNESQISSE